MNFDEYQKLAIKFDLLGDGTVGLASEPAYVAKVLGLAGEAGEVAEKYKKVIRDKRGVVSDEDKVAITKELGDVLWYVSALSVYLGVDLSEVAKANLAKLGDRKARDTQRGSGDNR